MTVKSTWATLEGLFNPIYASINDGFKK